MKSPLGNISLFGKTFLLLASTSVAVFVFVLLLATTGVFEHPGRVVFVTGGVVAFVSAVLFVGIWHFLLQPVSVLAQKLEQSGIARYESHDLTASRNRDVLARIEAKTAEFSRIAVAGELAIKRSEGIFSQIVSVSGECFCRLDFEGRFQYCDPQFVNLLGYHSSADLISETENGFANLIQDQHLADTFLSQLVEKSSLTENLIYLRRNQGTSLCVDLHAKAILSHTEEFLYFQINLKDASQLVSLATDLERTQHFQGLFSGVTNLLLLAQDEAQLTTEFCRLLVEKGNYLLAWIGAGIDDDDKNIRPLAVYGQNMGYVYGQQKSWASSIERGPVNEALKSGLPSVRSPEQ